jgi:hypothetical protein
MKAKPKDQAVCDNRKLGTLRELIFAIRNDDMPGQRRGLRMVCKSLLGRKPTGAELRNAGAHLNLGD